MAKSRKKARKSGKRGTKKSKRRVAAKTKSRKPVGSKPRRRTKPAQEGPIAGAIHAVVDTVHDAAELRRRLSGQHTFED